MMNTFTPFSLKFVSPKFLISQLLKMICRVSEIDQKQLHPKNHKAITPLRGEVEDTRRQGIMQL